MSNSKIIKPSYYDSFTCIADKCSFTCCQEWKIQVDDKTYQNWKLRLVKDIWKQTHKQDGNRVITLNKDKRCPHLNSCGLCSLVLAYGEEILSETCHTFPREKHVFSNRTEYTLAPCCPEVIDFLYKESDLGIYWQMLELKEIYSRELFCLNSKNPQTEQREEGVLFLLRALFLDILGNNKYELPLAYQMCFYIAISMLEARNDLEKQISLLKECETEKLQDNLGKKIAEILPDVLETFFERNELFLDITANYQKEGLYEAHLQESISLAEAYLDEKAYPEEKILDKWENFAVQIKPYEGLLRNYMLQEVYGDILLPGSTLEDFVVKMQWIAMEYAVLIQKWFLDFSNGDLTYEVIRSSMVVINRIMGYDEEDIKEYLVNSFDELIWEWGYLSLLIGK